MSTLMTETNIILATPSPAYEQRVRQAFGGGLNGELRHWRSDALAGQPEVAARELAEQDPKVVALGPGIHPEVALDLATVLDRDRPDICVLLVAEPTPRLWEHALRAGVRDIVAPDAPDAQVRETFERALETARRRRSLPGGGTPDRQRRVIVVISPKGGTGKTTVASNLAVGLARHAPGKVAIVDLDVQFGDVATALQLVPEQSFADAARATGLLDAMAVKAFLTNHETGLFALCAPESPVEGEEISAEKTRRILELLAGDFDHVVVDTSAGISEHTLSALEVSTDIVLVGSMDVPSIRSLRKVVAVLDQLGMTSQRRHFVLNRADARVGLDPGDIEQTVGLPIDVSVPSSRAVPLALNQGSPVVESDPRSPAAGALLELVRRFAEPSVSRATGLLRWVRSGR
ncbi:MAG: AAA family ATPase [Actinomycetota bacterium]|nr:AAA family ATPase [Actinomycetota bacterium]